METENKVENGEVATPGARRAPVKATSNLAGPAAEVAGDGEEKAKRKPGPKPGSKRGRKGKKAAAEAPAAPQYPDPTTLPISYLLKCYEQLAKMKAAMDANHTTTVTVTPVSA